MRKIKIGAVQPDYTYPAAQYDCMSDRYINDPEAILDNYIKKRMAVTFDLLERAGAEGCRAVTTSEDICGTSLYCVDTTESNIFPELLELSAPLVERELSGIASKYGMVIVGCYNKRIGGRNCNIASIFNGKGDITGEYRKTHLPAYEAWQITPGDTLGSFETDFGRIGMCICYDMMFPECVEAVALSGAEIIFHPTAGYGWYDSIGEATLRTRANDNSVYIVTAKNWVHNGAGKSSVIDHWGHVRSDAGFHRNAIVTCEIDLDEKKTQPNWYYPVQTSGIADVRERSRRERRPELYGALLEGHPGLEMPDTEKQGEIIKKMKSGECRW